MKVLREYTAILLIALIAGSTGGCALMAENKHTISAPDMFKGPSPEYLGTLPKITKIHGFLPFVEDMANYDQEVVAWDAEAVDIEGKRPSIPLTALRLNIADQTFDEDLEEYPPVWTIISTLPRESFDGYSIIIKEHCGKYLYNVAGEEFELKTTMMGKIKWEGIKQNFPAVTPDAPFIKELDSGTPEWNEIMARLAAFSVAKLGNQFSTLELKVMNEMVSKSKGAKRFLAWLMKDLRLSLTVPIGPPAMMAIQPVLTKIVEIPNLFAKKIGHSGCIESPATKEDSARITKRYHAQKVIPLKKRVRLLEAVIMQMLDQN